MKLSEHFTLEEMLDSQSAVRLGITEQFSPPDFIKDNLRELCVNVLEKIREKVNAPIRISSGYRCLKVNESIGGAITSQHTKGQAADISVNGLTTEELFTTIKNSGIVFDQLIQEFDRWVHISYTSIGNNRGQCLRAIRAGGATKYIPA